MVLSVVFVERKEVSCRRRAQIHSILVYTGWELLAPLSHWHFNSIYAVVVRERERDRLPLYACICVNEILRKISSINRFAAFFSLEHLNSFFILFSHYQLSPVINRIQRTHTNGVRVCLCACLWNGTHTMVVPTLIWASRREIVSAFGYDFHVVHLCAYLWDTHTLTHLDRDTHIHATERYAEQCGVKVQQLILNTFDKSVWLSLSSSSFASPYSKLMCRRLLNYVLGTSSLFFSQSQTFNQHPCIK